MEDRLKKLIEEIQSLIDEYGFEKVEEALSLMDEEKEEKKSNRDNVLELKLNLNKHFQKEN